MANVTGGPVHKPDRGSLPLACEIGLGPHVTGFRPPPGAVRRAGGAPFADTPVRTVKQLRWDMSDEDQTNIIRPFTALGQGHCQTDMLRCSLCTGGTMALDS